MSEDGILCDFDHVVDRVSVERDVCEPLPFTIGSHQTLVTFHASPSEQIHRNSDVILSIRIVTFLSSSWYYVRIGCDTSPAFWARLCSKPQTRAPHCEGSRLPATLARKARGMRAFRCSQSRAYPPQNAYEGSVCPHRHHLTCSPLLPTKEKSF